MNLQVVQDRCQGIQHITAVSEVNGLLIAAWEYPCQQRATHWTLMVDNVTGEDLLWPVCERHGDIEPADVV